jgi:hypothetical protein
MRRALNIALVLSSIFINVMASPNKTVAEMDSLKGQIGSVVTTSGLHVALPDNMMRFSSDLVPLPWCTGIGTSSGAMERLWK